FQFSFVCFRGRPMRPFRWPTESTRIEAVETPEGRSAAADRQPPAFWSAAIARKAPRRQRRGKLGKKLAEAGWLHRRRVQGCHQKERRLGAGLSAKGRNRCGHSGHESDSGGIRLRLKR